ncbi:MAG: M48 family metallopeptidase [Candidatus Liptonbacteria bacterium]
MAQSLYTNKESNIRKTWFIFTLFLIVVIGLGYLFAQIYGNPGILYFAVALSVSMSFVSYWFSDKIVLGMAGAQPVSMQNAPELYRIVENLAITAGLPTPKIYIVPEEQPNAFATGRDAGHAVVAVTAGLLARLDRSELEGVLAHELSHIGNRDMLVSTMVVVLVGFVSILSDIFLRSRLGFRGRSNGRDNGGVFLLIGIAASIFAPIAATLMQLAISRRREFLADSAGALLTRYPEGLANALERISSDPTPMMRVNNTTAHLWLASPYKEDSAQNRGAGGHRTSWLSKLFMTHPPIGERIAALRGMKI